MMRQSSPWVADWRGWQRDIATSSFPGACLAQSYQATSEARIIMI